MIRKSYLVVLTLAILTGTGCQKDPALVAPKDAYANTTYPATLDDLNSVLAATYSNLRDPGLFGFHFLPKAISNATHSANSLYNGDLAWNEMAATNLSVPNQYVYEAWQVLYTGVKNSNAALAGANSYLAKFAKPGDLSSVNLVRGQAYFMRGYYYFMLETLYGEDNVPNPGPADTLGVPLFDSLPATLAASQQGRASIKAVWALIKSDLNQAAVLLQGKVWTGNDIGRVTEWSAKGLLGKAHVFTKNYDSAKTVLLDLIQHSSKSLMPFDKYKNSFIGISANEFNEESLFELNVDQDSKGNYGVYGNAPNATTINGLIWCPWALGTDGTEGGAIAMGYGNEYFHDRNVLRYGFSIGSYSLVTNPNYDPSYDPTKSGYISDKWPKKIMDPVYKAASLQVRATQSCDPRLFVNALQPWVDSVEFDGKNWAHVSRPSAFAGDPTSYGFSFRKYTDIFNNINNVGPADATNLYFLRLADVYLLYAEACARTNDNVNAVEYLNKVKRRAYGLPVDAPSAVDYVSLTDKTSAFSAGDPVLGNNPLYYERWAELFNEGHWWQDVCRWHLGASEAAYYKTALNVAGTLGWNDKTYAWPIPLQELNSNSKIANQQNPGY